MSSTLVTQTVAITLFGETRDVECFLHGETARTVGLSVVGRFPTGTKLHGSSLTLWKRNMSTGRPLRGNTAAVIDGDEYVADLVLYQNNRNRGRIVAWNDDLANSGWRGY